MRLAGLVLAALLLLGAAPAAAAGVHLVRVEGAINPAVDDFVREAIAGAVAAGADALVIELDTPGGLLTSARSIVKTLLGAPLPVVVWVEPAGASATSAGVFVTMAAHVAAMHPGTTIGAAHPVGAQGEDVGGDMREKVENFTISFSRSIAEQRGRNVEWAAKAVRESVSITAKEAVEHKVVDLLASDLPELFRKVDGREVTVEGRKVRLALPPDTRVLEVEMRLRQRILDLVADPNVAYLLFLAGLLGLYFELANPGTVLPGVVGSICLLLALAAFQVLPISTTGALLILVSAVLIIAELFVPSFGVLGVGGVVAFTLGSLFLFDPADPTSAVDRSIIAAAVATVSVFMLGVGFAVLRAQRARVRTGAEGLVGKRGVARTRLAPEGRVFVHGESWTAVTEAAIEPGTTIEVLGFATGMTLRVRALPPPAGHATAPERDSSI